MVIANATGCSSIYGGNLPTTPWTKNAEGRGPGMVQLVFEDNAEFGWAFAFPSTSKPSTRASWS
jgi:pyruvate-ferredoxin/flavodoxin oxidoreductase